MFSDRDLLELAEQLARPRRSWLENKLISAGLFSYDDLKGEHSEYAPILEKLEFTKAIVFDLAMYGRLDRLLAELEGDDIDIPSGPIDDGQEGDPGTDPLVPEQEPPRHEAPPKTIPPRLFSRSRAVEILRANLKWAIGIGLTLITISIACIVLLFGNNLCSQGSPPPWMRGLLRTVCPSTMEPTQPSEAKPTSTPRTTADVYSSTIEPTILPESILTTLSPTIEKAPTPIEAAKTLDCSLLKLEISEIMMIPQAPGGDPELDNLNEYVELFNYGPEPMDLEDLWIGDTGGHPGRLVTWAEVFGGIPVGAAATDDSVVTPGGYALILPQAYEDGDRPYSDEIPAEAKVFTLLGTRTIGNGLVARAGHTLDVVVLYVGSGNEVDCVVSSYGTPGRLPRGASPSSIADDGLDDLPISIADAGGWGGFDRRFPSGIDTKSNWVRFFWDQRSPGGPPASQSQ